MAMKRLSQIYASGLLFGLFWMSGGAIAASNVASDVASAANLFSKIKEEPADYDDRTQPDTGLGINGSTFINHVPATTFTDADRSFFFSPNLDGQFNALSSPLDSVLTTVYLDVITYGTNPGFAEAVKLVTSNGYDLQEAGSYGNSPLYSITDSDGNAIAYISIVTPIDEDSAVLVLWDNAPI